MFRSLRLMTAAAGLLAAGAYMSVVLGAQATAPAVPVSGGYAGSDQFAQYCASCHGTGARGDGPLANVLKRRPPDLTLFAARNGGEFDGELVFQIIDGRKPVKGHGGGDMPVWGDAFARSRDGATEESVKARIDAIVKWLARIQQQKTTQ